MAKRFRKKAKARTIAVASRKGGVGKTFSAINIACCAANGGPNGNLPKLKVLVIDADSQQNSTYYYLKHMGAQMAGQKVLLPPNPNCEMGNIYNISDVIAGNAYMEYPTEWENIFLIPSDGRIDQLNDIATGDTKGFDDNQLNKFSAMLFDDLIEEVSDEYDLIVIDTPPSKTHASQGAIAASSDCLVVANPDAFCASNAVPGTVADILMNNDTFRNEDNQTNIIGILINKVSSLRPTSHEKDHIRKIRSQFPEYFSPELVMCNYVAFNTEIPQKPGHFEWYKHPQAKEQMENFYNYVSKKALFEIYAEAK